MPLFDMDRAGQMISRRDCPKPFKRRRTWWMLAVTVVLTGLASFPSGVAKAISSNDSFGNIVPEPTPAAMGIVGAALFWIFRRKR